MKYRDAKTLLNGDQVIRKSDKQPLIVISVEAYGQYKKCKINCVLPDDNDELDPVITLFNEEVE
jgi:hypothetical protein